MKHAIRLTLMVGVAAAALTLIAQQRGYTQSADANAAPNPYKMLDTWAQLPPDRKLGGVIKVQVDHSDGKSIWVFDRCGSNDAATRMVPPIQKFDASGKFIGPSAPACSTFRTASMSIGTAMSGSATSAARTARATS